MALKLGLRGLMTSATPVMVPPVPTPATRMSTLPSVSCQISSAVVLRWISGLAGFSNCCGMKLFLCSLSDRLGLVDRAAHSLGRGSQTTCAPSALSSRRRSMLIDSGIVSISLYPLAAQTNARAIPVLPLVGSTMTVSLSIFPAFGGLDHRQADAVFHAGAD
jgi:hypothetical protein